MDREETLRTTELLARHLAEGISRILELEGVVKEAISFAQAHNAPTKAENWFCILNHLKE